MFRYLCNDCGFTGYEREFIIPPFTEMSFLTCPRCVSVDVKKKTSGLDVYFLSSLLAFALALAAYLIMFFGWGIVYPGDVFLVVLLAASLNYLVAFGIFIVETLKKL